MAFNLRAQHRSFFGSSENQSSKEAIDSLVLNRNSVPSNLAKEVQHRRAWLDVRSPKQIHEQSQPHRANLLSAHDMITEPFASAASANTGNAPNPESVASPIISQQESNTPNEVSRPASETLHNYSVVGSPTPMEPGISEGKERFEQASQIVGTILDDKWMLNRLLGVGGMAAVYAATHRNGMRAAIKLMRFGIHTTKHVCERFLQEGYLANRVQHPAVVNVLDDSIDYEAQHAYLVMDLLHGETVRQRIDYHGPMRPHEAVSYMIELAECLSAAHAQMVVHRDIKPDNLFISEKGLRVLDFGIARAIDERSQLTQTGTSLGTPAYMSPEQARGKTQAVGPTTDIYAAGSTLFYMLTGETLHEGENAQEIMMNAAWGPPPPAKRRCPKLPTALASVIDHAVAFNQEERIQSAREFAQALNSCLDDLAGLDALERSSCTPMGGIVIPTRPVYNPNAETLSTTPSPAEIAGVLSASQVELTAPLDESTNPSFRRKQEEMSQLASAASNALKKKNSAFNSEDSTLEGSSLDKLEQLYLPQSKRNPWLTYSITGAGVVLLGAWLLGLPNHPEATSTNSDSRPTSSSSAASNIKESAAGLAAEPTAKTPEKVVASPSSIEAAAPQAEAAASSVVLSSAGTKPSNGAKYSNNGAAPKTASSAAVANTKPLQATQLQLANSSSVKAQAAEIPQPQPTAVAPLPVKRAQLPSEEVDTGY